jgi:hypothetical protein
MNKINLIFNESFRIEGIMSGPYQTSMGNNTCLVDRSKLPSQSIMGALFDPATKTFTFDEEYDAIQTAINTPPAEPEVTEPPAE